MAPPLFTIGVLRDDNATEFPVKPIFDHICRCTATAAGHPATFAAAMILVVAWGVTGPLFNFSETWQLVINTGTTIITFLMVFLIQNSQNRDTQAIHLKLDELVRVTAAARNEVVGAEALPEAQIAELRP